jgi:hypothetical protein
VSFFFLASASSFTMSLPMTSAIADVFTSD